MKKQYGKQLEETIELAMLLYPKRLILQEGYREFEHIEDCRFFDKKDGTYLKGYCLLSTSNAIERRAEEKLSCKKEIYLMDNGTFQKFYIATETLFCNKCNELHSYIHRVVAEDQRLSIDELHEIVEFITSSINLTKQPHLHTSF